MPRSEASAAPQATRFYRSRPQTRKQGNSYICAADKIKTPRRGAGFLFTSTVLPDADGDLVRVARRLPGRRIESLRAIGEASRSGRIEEARHVGGNLPDASKAAGAGYRALDVELAFVVRVV